jgi:hypothetical protein
VCLPFVHGRKHSHAFVVTQHGDASVEVIAPQRASDGLFDVLTTVGDPVEGWESEGGYVPEADFADLPAERATAAEDALSVTAGTAGPPVTAGKHCPRCDRNALYGIECAYCGHIIITALVTKPCHPPAWSEGCCPLCFTTDPEMWEVSGRLRCTVCAEGRSRWGEQVSAGPGWRNRARRVLAWVDNPGELSYALQYADGAAATGPGAAAESDSPNLAEPD